MIGQLVNLSVNQRFERQRCGDVVSRHIQNQLFKVEMKLLGFDDMQLSHLCACFAFQG